MFDIESHLISHQRLLFLHLLQDTHFVFVLMKFCSKNHTFQLFKWDKIYFDSHQNKLPMCGETLHWLHTVGLSNLVELLLGLSESEFEFDHLPLHLLIMRLQSADKVTHLPIDRALQR